LGENKEEIEEKKEKGKIYNIKDQSRSLTVKAIALSVAVGMVDKVKTLEKTLALTYC
jgi:hypothetical protein